jgi:uncharacterized protein (TIGR02271 family)
MEQEDDWHGIASEFPTLGLVQGAEVACERATTVALTMAPNVDRPEAGMAIDVETTAPGRTETRIPVIEESLQVQKVPVDKGGYLIVKTVETRDHVVDELLTNRRIHIERRPIGRELLDMAPPETRYEGETLIVPVLEEVLVTVKRLVLVEELRITRADETHRTPQAFTLRKENIEVERLAPETTSVKSS